MFKRWFLTFVMLLVSLSGFSQTTGYSNVSITTSATTNGSWSGGTTGPYVFSPTGDNAYVNTTEIDNRLNGLSGYTASSVSITTNYSSGTQGGSIYVDSSISAKNRKLIPQELALVAQGDLNVNNTIYVGPYSYSGTNYSGHNLRLEAGGSIAVNYPIYTTNTSLSYTYNGRLSDAGDLVISAQGAVTISNYLRVQGTNNTYNNISAFGSDAGSLRISGSGVSISRDIDLRGGTSAYTGTSRDGQPNDLTITTTGALTSGGGSNDGQTFGAIYANNFTKGGSGSFKLDGANVFTGSITISSGTLIKGSSTSISDDLATVVDGTLDLYGNNHQVGHFSGSGMVTSSQTGSVTLSLYNSYGSFSGILEDGSGVLSIEKDNSSSSYANSKWTSFTGNNTYSGSTHLKRYSKLIVGHSNGLGSTSSGTVVDNTSGLYLSGDISVGNESLSITGLGYSSYIQGSLQNTSGSNSWQGPITIGGASTRIYASSGSLSVGSISGTNQHLYVYGDEGSMTVSGTIALGTGWLYKYGNSTLTLQGSNSSTGRTNIYDGKVVVQHADALGSITDSYNYVSGGSLVLDGGITLNSRELRIYGNGYLSEGVVQFTATSSTMPNMNLFSNSKLAIASGTNTYTINQLSLSTYTLTISGWEGTYGVSGGGASSTAHLIISNTLSAAELSQIQFFDGTYYYDAVQLSTNELVPGSQK